MRKILITAAAAFAGMSISAHAADVHGGSLKDHPVAYEAPAQVWAGLYVGGSLGFGTGNTSGRLDAVEGLDGFFDEFFEDEFSGFFGAEYGVRGAIYGVHIGYNIENDDWVYGVELGLNGTDMAGSSPCVMLFYCSRSLDWYATAVARLGYASGRTLFYGFGGVAWGDVETEIGIISPGLTLLQGNETHVGWTGGVGIEHALTNRFIIGIEYSHVDLGEEDTALGEISGITDVVDLKFDAIKVRGSYKVSGGRAPLEFYK